MYYSGDGQIAAVHRPTRDPFVVQVLRYNDSTPVSGVPVEWKVNDGGGSFTEIMNVTDANGFANATLRMGPDMNTNVATASVQNAFGAPVAFSAKATLGYCRSHFISFSYLHVQFQGI
jgi:hypothetical protein